MFDDKLQKAKKNHIEKLTLLIIVLDIIEVEKVFLIENVKIAQDVAVFGTRFHRV